MGLFDSAPLLASSVAVPKVLPQPVITPAYKPSLYEQAGQSPALTSYLKPGLNTITGGLFGPAKTSTQAVPDASTPDIELQKIALDAGQSIARSAVSVGGTIATALGATKNTQVQPTGKAESWLFGDAPIRSGQAQLPYSIEAHPNIPAPLLAVGLVAGDVTNLIPFFGETKGAQAFLKTAQATNDAEKAFTLMKGAGFADDVAHSYAPLIAKETTPEGTKKIVDAAVNLQNTTKQGAKTLAQEVPVPASAADTSTAVMRNLDHSAVGRGLPSETATIESGTLPGVTSPEKDALNMSPASSFKNFTSIPDYISTVRDEAVARKSLFEKAIGDILGQTPETRVKSIESLSDKVQYEVSRGRNPDEIRDALAGRVVVPDANVSTTFDTLKNNFTINDKRSINYFDKPSALGYRGNNVAIQLKDGSMVELQIHTPISKKINDIIHPVYEKWRRLDLSTLSKEQLAQREQDINNVRKQADELWNRVSETPTKSAPDLATETGSRGTRPPTQGGAEMLPGNTSLPPKVAEKTNTVKKVWTDVVEYLQNESKRVLDLTRNEKLDLSVDPYQTMTLYHGRVGQKIEAGYDKAQEIAQDLLHITGRNKTNIKAGRDELSQYLQALHAPERNAALGEGAAGMTTAEAKGITGTASTEIKAVAAKALDLNKQTLNLLKDSGVITDELFDSLTTKYKNHVPLQRVMDEGDDIGSVLSGRGFDVKSTGIKAAKGSDRKVADVLTNIVSNYEQAVLRSEKNIVDNATLSFVRNNEKDLSNVMEIIKPKAIGKSFDGKILMEKTNDPTILQLYEKGKPIWIKTKDEKLAIALRGVGREKLGGILSAVGSFTRLYAGLATRFNPEFVLPNKIRDLQETFTFLAAQKDVGFKGALKTLAEDPKSTIADVTSALAGKPTEGGKLYLRLKELGGTTGGMGLSTRAQTELNIDKIFKNASSLPRQSAQKIVQYVDNFNTIFEDSTRLSVFKQALKSGLTEERAAFLAKEASINFNRSGRGGPVINALWMFSNVSIQGSAKMLMAMKNPKVAAAVATTMAGAVAATSEWNDRIDPNWRDKVTKWDRMNGITVMLPTDDGSTKYITIPISWGLKPINVMTNAAYDALDGKEVDISHATGDVFSSVIDGYNPVGGTDVVSALTPTALDAPTEIARNQSWSGAPIRPTLYDKNTPRDVQYFHSLSDTGQGKLSIEASKKLKDSTGILMSPADLSYAIDQYVGGAGRSIEKTSNLLYGLAAHDVPPADNWPFVSRFLRERTTEEVGQGAGGEIDKIKAALSDSARKKFQVAQDAYDTYKTMKSLPADVAAQRFDVLAQTNPELAKKISTLAGADALGLNYEEKLVQSMSVENGDRAGFIAEKFKALKTDAQKATLWDDYIAKKIITKQVAQQLQTLLVQ